MKKHVVILIIFFIFINIFTVAEAAEISRKNYYDKNNRLLGQEYSSGFAIGYKYDENGNLIRKVLLQNDANNDEVPDIMQFINGIPLDTPMNRYNDTDSDGWTDWQETVTGVGFYDNNSNQPGLAGGSTNITNIIDASTGEAINDFSFNFKPTNLVMVAGNLDGFAGDEIVIGADGDTGGYENFLYILTQSIDGWIAETISIGDSAVTSLAIGDAGTGTNALYVALQNPIRLGSIIEIKKEDGSWTTQTISTGTTQNAKLVGIRNGAEIVAILATNSVIEEQMYSIRTDSNGQWRADPYGIQPESTDVITIINSDLGMY